MCDQERVINWEIYAIREGLTDEQLQQLLKRVCPEVEPKPKKDLADQF